MVTKPAFRLLATTKRRVIRALKESDSIESLQSHIGLLGHGNAYYLQAKLIEKIADLKQ
jgi:hypothetical protein